MTYNVFIKKLMENKKNKIVLNNNNAKAKFKRILFQLLHQVKMDLKIYFSRIKSLKIFQMINNRLWVSLYRRLY